MHNDWTKHWSFKTGNLEIAFEAQPETDDPADHFEFSEDIDAVSSGAVEWFSARVVVYDWNGEELAADYLGACAYKTIAEFYQGHRDADPMNRNCSIMRAAKGDNVVICHYFPDMVSQAVSEARTVLLARRDRLNEMPLRAA